MIFPLNMKTVGAVREQFRNQSIVYFSKVFELLKEIERKEDSDAGNPIEVTLENTLDGSIPTNEVIQNDDGWKVLVPRTRTSAERNGTPIYLPHRAIEDFRDYFIDFHTETRCTLIPQVGSEELGIGDDPDIAKYGLNLAEIESKETCEERAAELYQQMRGI